MGRLRHLTSLLIAVLLGLAAFPAAAESYVTEELRIPMAAAGPSGLEALLVRLDGSAARPLVLISHGSPRMAGDRANFSALSYWPQAMEFARRGWTAVAVLRRGYGSSGGAYAESSGSCGNPDYYHSGLAAAKDLTAAIAFLSQRPDIDARHIISVGVSAGGFATVALTVDPPPGLVAAISFAGGRGSPADGRVCREDVLVDAFAAYGRASRIPMLWIYAENDHYFGPGLARRLADGFSKGGGIVRFLPQPAFGEDGHKLFSGAIARWTPLVDSFLAERGLTLRATPATLPHPDLRPPLALSANGRAEFERYLAAAPHKAFAMTPSGRFGWRSGQASVEKAKSGALENCAKSGRDDCGVRFLDDRAAER